MPHALSVAMLVIGTSATAQPPEDAARVAPGDSIQTEVSVVKSSDVSVTDGLLDGEFRWTTSGPYVAHPESTEDTYVSIKDPTVVFHEGLWHLFCTVRRDGQHHQIEHLSFADWDDIASAERTVLSMHDDFIAAPQVFYFAPQEKWYLIGQAASEAWDPKYGAAYATSTDIADPSAWSEVRPLEANHADGKVGLDFWIICDETKAHLFFTSLDGRMWREETSLADFPTGWSEAELALQADIFEASHTYKLAGLDKYLTVIEAQGGRGWRYFKAYLADTLDGEWTPLSATKDETFASMANTTHPDQRWTDCISHGEILRAGVDQRLEIDTADLR
ncbi:MAG TPA: non-reducing end alpha-L-arabinofuranosidase family hydrolase, partial [Armatimonadota bacterium]|nr:non-reducing end alpha-L-arabinofuranosidase family hydrolase [Armatimonadota bacterium]